MRVLIFVILLFFLNACQNTTSPKSVSYIYDSVGSIKTVEETPLRFRLDYPDMTGQVPLMLIVDGSTCRGPKTTGILKLLSPDNSAPTPYARLIVEKIGVGLNDEGEKCSDAFLQNYSIEDRLIQHLRVLQHLRDNASWWNGELLIWGWSDGGDIAAQLTAYYPDTKRAVLGAMGGGITMAESFQDVDFCPALEFETSEARETCLNKLEKKYDYIRRNPKWDETWLGEDNSLKVWDTRLFSRLSHLLVDNKTPILIVHGEHDQGQIKSARKLREALEAAENKAFTYWEIGGMGHSPRNIPPEQNILLYEAMRDWLLVEDVEQPVFEN